ncbi:MAG: hypothetical protein ACK5UE_07000 [Chitinophagales bacterium]
MKKNLPLVLVVIALVAVLAYLKYNKSKTNFEEIEFHIADVNEIGSIIISDKQGNKSVLRKADTKWLVNDSFFAEKAKMVILLQTINKLQIEMPIGDSMRKMAIQDLRTLGREITINNKDGDEIKTFYVGSQMGAGNVMILKENGIVATDPFIVKIPGIKATDLKHRFPANPNAWYTTEVFSTSIDKIKSITVNFHERPQNSFRLTKDEDLIKIDPLVDSMKINKSLNKEHVIQFLLEFESKHFEGKIKNDSVISYIKASKPAYTIELEDMLQEKRYIKLFKMPSSFNGVDLGSPAVDAMGKRLPFNLDKYWAYSSYSKDFAIAQYYVFGPILVPYNYFFEDKSKNYPDIRF